MRARIVHGAVLAALTATGFAWVSLDKTVIVEIDGQTQVVVTHAMTVSDVLDRAGVRVEPHDMLSPASGDQVRDGSRIIIKRGRLVTVRVNNVERPVWVNASDVSQVLSEIGVDADDRTYISASRSSRVPSNGMFALQVRMPAEVQLIVEGKGRLVVTTAATVTELLAAEGVTLTEHQYLEVDLDSYPSDGSTIEVKDKRGVRISRTRPIPFKTITSVDLTAAPGSVKVVHEGTPGVLVAYFRQLVLPGAPPVTVPDGSRVARAPIDRVVVLGPKIVPKPAPVAAKAPVAPKPPAPKPVVAAKPPVPKPPVPKPAPKPVVVVKPPAPKPVDALNWHALAMCESGNNPRALSPGGTYRGLYQFMMSTWRGVGGVGDPIDASREEQLKRAKILYLRAGSRSWGACGSRLFS